MNARLTLLVAACFPVLAFGGEDNFTFLNMPRAGSGEVAVCALLLVLLLLSIVVFELVKIRYELTRERLVSGSRFTQNAGRFSLDGDERTLMRAMGTHVGAGDLNDLFYSQPLYEAGVEGEANAMLRLNSTDEALETREKVLKSLRRKLHYAMVDPGVPITSTRNMAIGQPVWILSQKKSVIGEGLVMKVKELSFSVRLGSNSMMRSSMLDSCVRMAFTRRGDGVYGIDAPFVDFDPVTSIITCRHTLSLRRNQMRADVRVDTDFPIGIRCIASERSKPTDGKPFRVRTVDISGGGISFISDHELHVNDTVVVNTSTARLSLEGVQARIVAQSRHYGSSRALYHGQFIAIDVPKKERIVKYVFEKLREINQR
jgi:hypothetical protein